MRQWQNTEQEEANQAMRSANQEMRNKRTAMRNAKNATNPRTLYATYYVTATIDTRYT